MNALELADLLEVDSWYKLVTREEIATMLRQLHARVEELEGCINDCYIVQKMQAEEVYRGNAENEALKKEIQNMAMDNLVAIGQEIEK